MQISLFLWCSVQFLQSDVQGDVNGIVPFGGSIEDYSHTPNQNTCTLAITLRDKIVKRSTSASASTSALKRKKCGGHKVVYNPSWTIIGPSFTTHHGSLRTRGWSLLRAMEVSVVYYTL